MERYLPHFICLTLLTCGLSACIANTNPTHATCRVLKSDIVFNGATSNVRQAEMDAAEAQLQQANYDVHCS